MLSSAEMQGQAIPSFSVLRDSPRPEASFLRITSLTEKRVFLDRFMGALIDHGFEPNDIVFSGFDGTVYQKGEEAPEPQSHIWVMDTTFWQRTIEWTATSNAAEYAERPPSQTPCIGLYDIDQLRLSEEGEEELELRELQDLGLDEGIFSKVTHADYPNSLPASALQGLVFLEYRSELPDLDYSLDVSIRKAASTSETA